MCVIKPWSGNDLAILLARTAQPSSVMNQILRVHTVDQLIELALES